MSVASAPCAECRGNRWMLFEARWKNDELVREWRPFSRDAWSHLSLTERSIAIHNKLLSPCTCNPNSLPPWHKTYTGGRSNAG